MQFSDIQAQLANGSTCVDIIQAALERAEADTLNCVVRTHAEDALKQAAAIDERRGAGDSRPLDGVPMLVKDNLCVEGMVSTCASRMLGQWKAPYTATAVQRLQDAGAVVIGHANMDEFAMGSSNETSAHGPVNNPHDPERIPGGSSGGSAAAVAAGIVPLALGSDTGGSIRQPASLCGCVGLKPTYGRVSRYGLIAFGSSLDQIGPLTNSVSDAALSLQIMAGLDPLDGSSLDMTAEDIQPTTAENLSGLKVGWVPAHNEGSSPAVQAAMAKAREALVAKGAELVEIELPHEQYAVATYYIIATGEASSNLSRFDGVHYGHRSDDVEDLSDVYTHSRSEGFGAEVKRRILLGSYVLSAGYYDAYYKKAMQVRALIMKDFAAAFAQCDMILGPTSPTVAFKRGEKSDPLSMYMSDIYTISANLAGIPALSLPAGSDEAGLPIGVHLQAASRSDGKLLSTALAIEESLAQW